MPRSALLQALDDARDAALLDAFAGKRDGAIKTLRAIAAALGVSVDDLE